MYIYICIYDIFMYICTLCSIKLCTLCLRQELGAMCAIYEIMCCFVWEIIFVLHVFEHTIGSAVISNDKGLILRSSATLGAGSQHSSTRLEHHWLGVLNYIVASLRVVTANVRVCVCVCIYICVCIYNHIVASLHVVAANVRVCVCSCIRICVFIYNHIVVCLDAMGWLRLVGSLKLSVSIVKEPH